MTIPLAVVVIVVGAFLGGLGGMTLYIGIQIHAQRQVREFMEDLWKDIDDE